MDKNQKKSIFIILGSALVIVIVGLIVMLIIQTLSSSPDKKEAQDYSFEQEDLALQQELQLQREQMELARQDSIRQDSIQKEEEKANRLTILTFCKYDPSEKIMDQLSGTKIYSNLKALGFTQTGRRYLYSGDGCIEMTEEITTFEREKYGNFVKVTVYGVDRDDPSSYKLGSVEITFSDSEQRDYFIQTALQNRFKKRSANYYEGYNPDDIYWDGTSIEVSGNTVTLTDQFEC